MTSLGTNNIMDTRQAVNRVTELFKIINTKNYKNIMDSDTSISEQIKEMTTTQLETIENTFEETRIQTSEKIAQLKRNIAHKRRYLKKKNKISKSGTQDQIQINTELSAENTNDIDLDKIELFFNDKIVKQYEEYNIIMDYIIDKIAFEQFKKTIQEHGLTQLLKFIKDTIDAQNKLRGHNVIGMTNLGTNNIMDTRQAVNRFINLFKIINKIDNKNIMDSDTMISKQIEEIPTNELEIFENTIEGIKFETSEKIKKMKKKIVDKRRSIKKNNKISKSIAQDQIQVNTDLSAENTNDIKLNEFDFVKNKKILKQYEEYNIIMDYIIKKMKQTEKQQQEPKQLLKFIKDTIDAQNKLRGHNVIDMTKLGTNNIMDTRQAVNRFINLFKIINKIDNKNIMDSDTMISKQIEEIPTNELEIFENTIEGIKFETSEKIKKMKKKIVDKRRSIKKNNKISKSIAQDQIQVNTDLSAENTNDIKLNEFDFVKNKKILKQYEEYNIIMDYIIKKMKQTKKQQQEPKQLLKFIKDTIDAQNKLRGHNVIDMTKLGTNNIMDTRQVVNRVTNLFSIINTKNYKNIKEHETMISNKIKEIPANELEIIENKLDVIKIRISQEIQKLNKKIFNKRHRTKKNKILKSGAQDQIQVNTKLSAENTNDIDLDELDRAVNKEIKQYEEYNTIIDDIKSKIALKLKETEEEQGPRAKRARLQEEDSTEVQAGAQNQQVDPFQQQQQVPNKVVFNSQQPQPQSQVDTTESTRPLTPMNELIDKFNESEENLNAHDENSQFDLLKLIEDNNKLMPSSQQQQHQQVDTTVSSSQPHPQQQVPNNVVFSSQQQHQHPQVHYTFASSSQQPQH